MKNKYALMSLVTTALATPLGLAVGMTLEYILKSTNPSEVNIAGELAYLAPILLMTIIVVGGMWVISLGYLLLAKSRKEDPALIKIALITVLVTIGLVITGFMFKGATDKLVENYKDSAVQAQE